jgi:16S rRNA (guanine1207-N2)-methyltransferase
MKIAIEKLKEDIVFEKRFRGTDFTFHSTWGLFSPREVDEGSVMLINVAPVNPTDVILDLGCGYGPIGIAMARQAPEGKVHMVDKDFVAIEYAQKNAKVNSIKNKEIYLSNMFSRVPDIEFDRIVSNLPAKVGKEFLWIILEDAKAHLKKGGTFTVVTISGLKEFVKRNFTEVFGNYEKLSYNRTYTVSQAVKE